MWRGINYLHLELVVLVVFEIQRSDLRKWMVTENLEALDLISWLESSPDATSMGMCSDRHADDNDNDLETPSKIKEHDSKIFSCWRQRSVKSNVFSLTWTHGTINKTILKYILFLIKNTYLVLMGPQHSLSVVRYTKNFLIKTKIKIKYSATDK